MTRRNIPSAQVRVAARDLKAEKAKLFATGATVTLIAFLVAQLVQILF